MGLSSDITVRREERCISIPKDKIVSRVLRAKPDAICLGPAPPRIT